MVTFHEENVDSMMDQIVPLNEAHGQEIDLYKDIKVEVDYDYYRQLHSAGMLKVYTARKGDKLVGYNIFIIKNHPHYKSSKQAHQDVLYVDPKERGFGMKFVDWCDTLLQQEGVQVVYHVCKKAHDFGPKLEKLGYELMELTYSRRLN